MFIQKILPLDNWGLDRIDQIQLPLDGLYKYNLQGSNVDVAIVDSGITEVDDIKNRVFHISDFRTYLPTHNENYIPNTSSEFGKDFIGHGTHISGIVGGKIYGVAKNCNLFSFKIYHKNFDFFPDLVENVLNDLFNWHLSKTNPTVVILNFADKNFLDSFDNILSNLNASGRCTILCPAGNFAEDANNYYPANSGNTVTVGSINKADNVSIKNAFVSPVGLSSSNFGSALDIFAPGEDVYSIWLNNKRFRNTSTTCATAFVAGVAALYFESSFPNINSINTNVFRSWLEESAIKNKITNLPDNVTPNRILFSPFQNFSSISTSAEIYYFNEKSSVNLPLENFLRFGTYFTENLKFKINNLPPSLSMSNNGTIIGVTDEVDKNLSNYVSATAISADILPLLSSDVVGYAEYSAIISASAHGLDFSRNVIFRVLDKNNFPVWNVSSKLVNIYISASLFYGNNVQFSFSNLISDFDDDILIFQLLNGELPKGLILSSNGILKGIVSAFPVSSSSVFFVSAGLQSKSYEFTVRATDGFFFVDQFFSARVFRDSNGNNPPSFVTSGYPKSLVTLEKGSEIAVQIIANDNENDELVFRLASAITVSSISLSSDVVLLTSLPSGIKLSSNGKLEGIVTLDVSSGKYVFQVDVFDGYDITSELFSFEVVDIGTIFGAGAATIGWLSDTELGEVEETYPSLIDLKAFDSEGAELEYILSPGSLLPPGLSLDQTRGYITGNLEYIPADTNYSFFVRAQQKSNPLVFVEKQFVISAKDMVSNPIGEFSLQFSIQGNNQFSELLFAAITSSFPEYLDKNRRYREIYDSNFPTIPKREILLTKGTILQPDSVVLSALGFDINTFLNGSKTVWKEIELILGETKKAVARNEKGEIVYEVVYIEILDENSRNLEFDVVTSSKSFISTGISAYSVIVPVSLENMRKDIEIDIGLEKELLPLWMRSGQESANSTPLGYVPSFVLMYLKPSDDNELILEQIKLARQNTLPYGTKIRSKSLIYRKYTTSTNNPEEFLIHFPVI